MIANTEETKSRGFTRITPHSLTESLSKPSRRIPMPPPRQRPVSLISWRDRSAHGLFTLDAATRGNCRRAAISSSSEVKGHRGAESQRKCPSRRSQDSIIQGGTTSTSSQIKDPIQQLPFILSISQGFCFAHAAFLTTLRDMLKLPFISHQGDANEIVGKFDGADQLRTDVTQLQSLLYPA